MRQILAQNLLLFKYKKSIQMKPNNAPKKWLKALFIPIVLICNNWTTAQFYEQSQTLDAIRYGLSSCSVDWNNDGKMDVLAGGYAGEKLKLHLQQADNTYSTYIFEAKNAYMEVHGLGIGDFNNDGLADVIIGGNPLICLLGDGQHAYKEQIELSANFSTSIVVADFDNNGTDDLAVISEKKLVVYWNDGTGKFTASFPCALALDKLQVGDINNDKKPDLVGISTKDGKDEIIVLLNDGQQKFSAQPIAHQTANTINLGDINNDKLLDILVIDNRDNLLHIFLNEGNGVFKKTASVFTNAFVIETTLVDVNQDNTLDIALIGYDGSLAFLFNNSDGSFSHSPILAKIPNYVRSVQLLPSTEKQTLRFLHTGLRMCGIHSVYLPKMPNNSAQPFEVIHSKEALNAIQKELKKDYVLDEASNEIYAFAYLEPLNVLHYKKGYLVEIENEWYRFDEQGRLLSEPASVLPRYSPLKKTTEFKEYNFENEFAENESNKKAGKATNYSSFIINDFLAAYYPNAVFNWQSTTNGFFSFKGTRDLKGEQHELFLDWQSYSDGSEWNFWTTDLFRSPIGTPAFDVIKRAPVATKIKNYVAARYAPQLLDSLDVFKRATRSFVTPQQSEKIPFKANETLVEVTYGVYVKGKLLTFDLEGNFLNRQ